MKKTKIILSMFVFLIILVMTTNGQTNVSGGIYTNTTWTAANSPYIVVDTVVVFPGVTLTIQPGVVVKFNNNTRLEIRQASIIAQGTVADSILFTSSSANPSLGIWSSIYLNHCPNSILFNYCNFHYAGQGIYDDYHQSSLTVKNSKFKNNQFGLRFIYLPSVLNIDSCEFNNNTTGLSTFCSAFIQNCLFKNNNTGIYSQIQANIDNCVVLNNQTGINLSSVYSHTVVSNSIIDSNTSKGISVVGSCLITNCNIKNNNIGLHELTNSVDTVTKNIIENNNIGIQLESSTNLIYCNKICSNSTYDLYYNVSFSNNTSVANNYWCTSDSVTTAAHIYDGYDNINKGLVYYMPIDTNNCYLTTSVNKIENNLLNIYFFPNPAHDYLTINLQDINSPAIIKVYNFIGQLEFLEKTENTRTEINISRLNKGIYIIELVIVDKIIRKKFIKQ